jgi:hypothetical protein
MKQIKDIRNGYRTVTVIRECHDCGHDFEVEKYHYEGCTTVKNKGWKHKKYCKLCTEKRDNAYYCRVSARKAQKALEA